MMLEGLPPVANLFARSIRLRRRLVALPDFQLKVLAVLVPLPVILGPEASSTLGESAGIWLIMAFEMFLEIASPGEGLLAVLFGAWEALGRSGSW
jgi:hypothetical protein